MSTCAICRRKMDSDKVCPENDNVGTCWDACPQCRADAELGRLVRGMDWRGGYAEDCNCPKCVGFREALRKAGVK